MTGEEIKREAILVWISEDDDLVNEARELCSSAGYRIVAEVRQSRDQPHTKYYIGPGKIIELQDIEGVSHLITPTDLSPSQIFNMGKMSGLIVVDRIRVVLELFRSRATSPESRLQVEIADLKYQLPILREFIHQGTLSDRPGFLAGGEYRVDYYYEMARKRMAHIKQQLAILRKRRGMTRTLRKRRGSHLVAVAGYTNAGKSTLLNAISDARMPEKSVDTADKMFTTIATSTRKMKGDRDCIITDTVGFIRDLPPWLVEGFMSTLEEVFESDIILLLVDASDEKQKATRKTLDSLDILRKGDCSGKIVLVMNKMDAILEGSDHFIPERDLPFEYFNLIDAQKEISARNLEGLEDLIEIIGTLLPDLFRVRIELPLSSGSERIMRDIRNRSIDLNIDYSGTIATIECRMEERWAMSLRKAVDSEGGSLDMDI